MVAATPRSTYRLQIRRGFDLDAAAEVAGYLRDLGVTGRTCRRCCRRPRGRITATTSWTRRRSTRSGGRGRAGRFAAAARAAGLGILIDTVPNHMGISRPTQNPWWWDVLTYGRRFAVRRGVRHRLGLRRRQGARADPRRRHRRGDRPGAGHDRPGRDGPRPARGRAFLRRARPSSRYRLDLRFRWADSAARRSTIRGSIRADPRAAALGGDLLAARGGGAELPPLLRHHDARRRPGRDPVGVRREPRRSAALGARRARRRAAGRPPGRAASIRADTSSDSPPRPDSAYVLVEKILEHGEELPAWWETDGTTGYDALARDRPRADRSCGRRRPGALDAQLRADTRGETARVPRPHPRDEADDRRHDPARGDRAARARTARCSTGTAAEQAHDALAELLACFPVYRSYLPAGRRAAATAPPREASARRPDLAETIARLVPVLADPAHEVARRFQQTTGPVMAKGVEDTAFYRYTRLGSLTEVGGDPSVFALSVEGFHRAQALRQASWPDSMTTLSTHDTKRGEDVRARLDVLAEMPERWAAVLGELRERASTGTVPSTACCTRPSIGSWPASRERLHGVRREGRARGRGGDGLVGSGCRVRGAHARHRGRGLRRRRAVATLVADFVAGDRARRVVERPVRQAAAAHRPRHPRRLSGLRAVGDLARRPRQPPPRRLRRAATDAGRARRRLRPGRASRRGFDRGAAKLLVTSRALRLRRDRPDLFTQLHADDGRGRRHPITRSRSTAAARSPSRRGCRSAWQARGGWGDTVLLRHSGLTTDALTGRTFAGSTIRLDALLATYPVALLVPATAGEVSRDRGLGTRGANGCGCTARVSG